MRVGCRAGRTHLTPDSWTPDSWCHNLGPPAPLPFQDPRRGPEGGRGLLKEAGKPQGCPSLPWSHGGSSETEEPMVWLSSSENLSPTSPRLPGPAYSDQIPSPPMPPKEENLCISILHCLHVLLRKWPWRANFNKAPLKACAGGWGETSARWEDLLTRGVPWQ